MPLFGLFFWNEKQEDKIISNRKIICYGESIHINLHTPPIKPGNCSTLKDGRCLLYLLYMHTPPHATCAVKFGLSWHKVPVWELAGGQIICLLNFFFGGRSLVFFFCTYLLLLLFCFYKVAGIFLYKHLANYLYFYIFVYLLINIFIYLYKQSLARFNSFEGRFLKRTFALFWVLEFFLFFVFIFVFFLAPSESLFLDQAVFVFCSTFYFYSFFFCLICCFFIFFFFYLAAFFKSSSRRLFFLLLHFLALYVFFLLFYVEFSRFLYILSFFNSRVSLSFLKQDAAPAGGSFSGNDLFWRMSSFSKKKRTVVFFFSLLQLVKFWHVFFCFIFFLFYLFFFLSRGSSSFLVLALNIQNSIYLLFFNLFCLFFFFKSFFYNFIRLFFGSFYFIC